MKKIYWLISSALAIASGITSASQPQTGPDLRVIPGMVLDHNGIEINPTPVSIERPYTGVFNLSSGLKPYKIDPGFEDEIKILPIEEGGIPFKLVYGKDYSVSGDFKPVPGAYKLWIGPEEVVIAGYDREGAFYGLQTLRQIVGSLQRSGSNDLPMMEVSDYPSLKYRGVVEGFYGRPWSHETRLSIIGFMGQNKMNCYVYGPKDDPYHRTPKWREPYPADEGQKIKELAEHARKNHVNFVWAIHPGGDINWNKEDYDKLLKKFSLMYDLGIRQFAIFFDDIKGDGTDSRKQTELLNGVVRDFLSQKKDVGNLIVCPTDYNQAWANPSENGQLAVYGQELDPAVEVFWTGKVVCGDIEPASMEFVDSRIQRPALVWWNFPVTDYCKHNLLLGPVYGLDPTLDSAMMAGIVSNPMENGEASKSAIFGVADYAWNPSSYNALDNWNRSFKEVMPGAPSAYSTFAIHSCDPPKNYRRNESWNVETFRYNNYTREQFDKLYDEFKKIRNAPDIMFHEGRNISLLMEIAPWLIEFSNLGDRGLKALDLIKAYESGDKETYRCLYEELRLLNEVQKPGYLKYRSGTLKLQPFIDNVLEDIGAELKKSSHE